MARKYVNKLSTGDWSKPIGLSKLMYRAGRALKPGAGPFTLTQDGDPLGPPGAKRTILDRFKQAISNRDIGPVFRIRRDSGDVVFTARAVQLMADTDSTNGNARSDSYWNWVRANFAEFSPRFAGSYVCKLISGSQTKSQHSYGNAVDVFFDTLAQQEKVANAVVANAAQLHPFHVIDLNRTWTKGVGWHATPGNDHYHLHVDFDPQYSGECGVRG